MKLRLPELIRANIMTMQPYASARSLADHGQLFMDANEAPDFDTGVSGKADGFNRYPSPQPPDLRAGLANLYEVRPEQILMGRGADEAIDLLVRATCEPGQDAIVSCPPTYGMYSVTAAIQGANHLEVPMLLDGGHFRLNTEALGQALHTHCVKLLFICRPNNPTGDVAPMAQVKQLAKLAGSSTLVVVDEAYQEFAPDEVSATTLIDEFENVVVLRTFSKAWALAGARFGVAIGHADLIAVLEKVCAPYPISTPVRQLIAPQLTEHGRQTMHARVAQIRQAREALRENLSCRPSVEFVYPSAANYLLVKVPGHAQALLTFLKERGIIVRDRSNQSLLMDCLRITVGSPSDNNTLIKTWKHWEMTRRA